MIRWLLIAVAGLMVVIAAVWLIGLGLPQDHSATVSRDLPASIGVVWERITDPEDMPRWRPDVNAVEVLESRNDGLPRWRERGSRGAMTLQATRVEPLDLIVLQIADEGLPFGGTWTYRLEPTASGTRLTITEDGEIYNPIFRFVSRFVLGYEGTMTRYLDALEEDLAAP